MHKTAERLIMNRARGGKTRFASVLDALAFALIAGGALYFAVRPHFANRTAAVFVTLTCLGICSLTAAIITRTEREKRVDNIREELRKTLIKLKLLENPKSAERALSGVHGACFVPKAEKLTGDDVLDAYRKGGADARIVTFAEPTAEAKKLIKLIGMSEPVLPFDVINERAEGSVSVTEDEIDRAAAALFQKQKRLRPGSLTQILRERAFKFILLGATLYALSFAVRYQLTYRIFAALALGLGSAFSMGEWLKRRA